MKHCGGCNRDLPCEAFRKNKSASDGLASQCRECRKIGDARYRRENRGMIRARNARYHSKNQEAIRARNVRLYRKNREARLAYQARYRSENLEACRARDARYYSENREAILAANVHYARRKYQRSGKGVHMARIQDWREFFDSLTSDAERCIAAHVLVLLGSVDGTAKKIVADLSFDFEYLAQHFE